MLKHFSFTIIHSFIHCSFFRMYGFAKSVCTTYYRYLGLDSHLILRTSRELADSDPGLTGNLLLARMVRPTPSPPSAPPAHLT